MRKKSIATTHSDFSWQYTPPHPIRDQKDAFAEAVALLTDPKQGPISSLRDIAVVGHRVVHGAEMSKALVIDSKVRA